MAWRIKINASRANLARPNSPRQLDIVIGGHGLRQSRSACPEPYFFGEFRRRNRSKSGKLEPCPYIIPPDPAFELSFVL
jgi:hypothetical protein